MKRYFFSLLLISAGTALAQAPPSAVLLQQFTYAPVGIAAGTTLRLNVANIGSGTSVCMGNLSYINSDGTSIKNENITVNAGQTASYALLISDIAGTPASAEVRGLVKIDQQFGGTVGRGASSCTAVMSLEVVDAATGQTRAVLTNPTAVAGFPVVTPVTTAP